MIMIRLSQTTGLPAKDLTNTERAPAHAHHSKKHQYDIDDSQREGAEHEARTEDAVQHQVAPEMTSPHGCCEINGAEVEEVGGSSLDDVGKELCSGVCGFGCGGGRDAVMGLERALPKDCEWDSEGSEDLSAEGIEDDKDRGPGVCNCRERDEG